MKSFSVKIRNAFKVSLEFKKKKAKAASKGAGRRFPL